MAHKLIGKPIKCKLKGCKTFFQRTTQKRHQIFCSHSCYGLFRGIAYRGENNPSWKGGLVKCVCRQCAKTYLQKPSRKNTTRFCSPVCRVESLKERYRGEGGSNWQGGITAEHITARHLSEYKKWIRQIKKRDNYTCRLCGSKKSVEANHIIPFRKDKYNYDLMNGITLCRKCHSKTFLKEEKYYHVFKEILNDYMLGTKVKI